jgi:hypothetical protein
VDSGFAGKPHRQQVGSFVHTLFPTRMLEPDGPLVVGTLKRIEQSISPGGQPLHTGWMADGA